MLSLITEFRNTYEFLSNFYPSEITFAQRSFPTAEHAYQWYKASLLGDAAICIKIASAKTPGEAKRLGRKAYGDIVKWERTKIEVMRAILDVKFSDPVLRDKLVSTFPHVLIEGNTWKDTFWGYDFNLETGMNWLGLLLMEVRNGLIY